MKLTLNQMNVSKLHDEFVKAEIIPILVEHDRVEGEVLAENIWITFKVGTDMELVQQVIDNHDPTPLPQPKSETEMLKDRLEFAEMALIQIMMEG